MSLGLAKEGEGLPIDARDPLHPKRINICLACSHGGHLAEMLDLQEAFEGHDTFFFCYDAETTRRLPRAYLVPNMARNPIEFLKNLFRLVRIFRRERPDLVVSTGAEIAIPVLLIAKVFRIATIYIECGAQVTHASVTGRIAYWLADSFFVQWPELMRVYGPRARFRGSLIDEDPLFDAQGDSTKPRIKVCLVQPAHTGGFSSDQPPMGLGYIASALERAGCEVRLLDANAERLNQEDLVGLIAQFQPRIVAFTVTTPLLPSCLALAHAVRCALPGSPVLVAGGPHATVLPDEMLDDGEFDYVVRGEGETPIVQLVAHLQAGRFPAEIEGISWCRDGEIVHNPDRSSPEYLEQLTMPDWALFPLRRYSSLVRRHDFSLPILTSRGCPHRCTFCYKGTYGHTLRMRSPKHVVDEWQLLIERFGAREIAVVDDVFTENSKRAISICEMLVERGLHRIPWSTTNGIRVNNVTPRLMRAMKEAGCYRVYFGVESGVQRIVDALGKNISLTKVRDAVATARSAGLEVGLYFMLGNLGETAADMDQTIALALDLDPDLAQFTIATPYPGTEMYRQVVEQGHLLFDSWDELASYGGLVFTHGELSPDLVGEKYRTALRRFYLRPRLVLRRIRQLATWTGLKNHLMGALVLLSMLRKRSPA